jgi:hypothetical protein
MYTAYFENAGYYFFAGKYFMGHLKGYFEGAKTPKLSRAQRGTI